MALIEWLWAGGAAGAAVYMLAALLRPEKF